MNHPQECCRSSSIGVTSSEIPLACAHLRHPVETNCGVGPTVGHGPVACSRRASTDDLDINGALDCALDFYQSEMSQGIVDGAKAAEASNVSIATVMGVQRGGTVGIELGFYRGIAAAWAAKGLMMLHADCSDPKGAKLVRMFPPILDLCGLALEHDMDALFSNLSIVRRRFKSACAACSMQMVEFEDGSSKEDDFSF